MAVPDSPRVVYGVNLLEHVSCNLRFPAILTMGPNPPVAFFERVREDFPIYKLSSEVKVRVGGPLPALDAMFSHDAPIPGTVTHVFESEDTNWNLKLTREGLILSCKHYDRWETFASRLRRIVDPLWDVYKPSFIQHACVRYKNSVRRSLLKVRDDHPWSALLRPWLGGALLQSEVAAEVEQCQQKTVLQLPEGAGKIEATCSLGRHQPSQEAAFVIESHVYHEQTKRRPDVMPRLETLHRWAGRFFRWCITDELHELLHPSPVPEGESRRVAPLE